MQDKLKELSKEKVLKYFMEISKIPHPSFYMEKISNYCVDFAKERNLKYYQDSNLNVIIYKEAGSNKKDSPAVIIQGHLDMVGEKSPSSNHDFRKDPLHLCLDGDFLYAKDTTLGADDGVAIAIALALLDEDAPDLPAIEAVFTVDEEVGLLGASSIDLSSLKGKYLFNIDSGEEGVFIAGCAGGLKGKTTFRFEREKVDGLELEIKVEGLLGGHSGVEIDKERGNSNKIIGQILSFMNEKIDFSLIKILGGNQDNAIPRKSIANIVIDAKDKNLFKIEFDKIFKSLKKEFQESDPKIRASFQVKKEGRYNVIEKQMSKNIISFLLFVPNGVKSYSQTLKNTVESSLNLGIVTSKDETIEFVFALRSSIREKKIFLSRKLAILSRFCGASYEEGADYPEWEYKANSELENKLKLSYKEIYKVDPEIRTVHAGLECGYLLEKLPGVEAVSLGPDMYGIHTTEEKLSVSSFLRVYNFIFETLKKL